MISVTSTPPLWIERIADSLPFPGPLTYTFTFLNPASNATFVHSSAANCAAYGVFFLEPLKPILPADAQEITSPFLFVKEMIILLKVALMCASPVASITTLRFFVFALAIFTTYYLVAFFLLAPVFFLPFLVLELFFVR